VLVDRPVDSCHVSPSSDWSSVHRLSEEHISDVKRGQNLEAEANFWRLRPRPRPKNFMKKVPNND